MKYVASIVVEGVEEAGLVTNMFDMFGRDTTDPEEATAAVIQCSAGFITVQLIEPVYVVH